MRLKPFSVLFSIAQLGWNVIYSIFYPVHPRVQQRKQLVPVPPMPPPPAAAAVPIAKWLEERYPHRIITHSFLATAVVAVMSSPLLFFLHWHYWIALVLGHFCGWFSDCFTKAGVAAFFPSPSRLVIPGNPKARLESKSPAEYWILAIVVFLSVASVNLISAGGISEQFARSFFQDAATAA
jgi:inner membrane protein